MKQHITKKQWNELNYKEKEKLVSLYFGGLNMNFNPESKSKEIEPKLSEHFSIGRMIEFLGDDWDELLKRRGTNRIKTVFTTNAPARIDAILLPKNDDLCDYLWQAVKSKLCK